MTLEIMVLPTFTRSPSMNHAILETLAYSDIFDYPLRFNELYRYLPILTTARELSAALNRPDPHIETLNGYYFLAGRRDLVSLRLERQEASRPAFRSAMRYGRLLGRLPFIRMVALTGSLAVHNCDEKGDLDYLLVAAQGRVWMARAFALLLGRWTAFSGHVLCPNVIISERALEWPQPDLYSARELCQMIPISGAGVYHRLRLVNAWTFTFLPNAANPPGERFEPAKESNWLARLGEMALSNSVGDRLEEWEMRRKAGRFSRQPGFGAETQFNAEICQGNFHHHGAWTRAQFQKRVNELGLERLA